MAEINWKKLRDKYAGRDDARVIYEWVTSGFAYESEYREYHDIFDAYAVIEVDWPIQDGIQTYVVFGYIADRDEWISGARPGPLLRHLLPCCRGYSEP
jgi:hypothetical protein